MNTGIVTELDRKDGIGLIDADDGHVVIFNRDSLTETKISNLRVGARVVFTEERTDLGPRAVDISLTDRPESRHWVPQGYRRYRA
jgi:cold shock CspA family protein